MISEVQITPVKPQNGLVAFASFTLNHSLYCSGIAIFTRPAGGYRLVYPTKTVGYRDMHLYHPITRELGQTIEQEVINKYQEVMTQHGRHNGNQLTP